MMLSQFNVEPQSVYRHVVKSGEVALLPRKWTQLQWKENMFVSSKTIKTFLKAREVRIKAYLCRLTVNSIKLAAAQGVLD